ncbi:MAG: hypothetical protein M3112_07300 [Actinomycetia bacterium]|nr:hypothetical protein [Actinomycetes bacterium]
MQCGTRLSSVAVAIALVSVACTSDGSEQDASSVDTQAQVTTLVSVAATEPQRESTTTTTSVPKTVLSAPEYQIVDRIEGDSGDTVIVLLDPETYGPLTDLDLYDLIAEVVELFPPIAVVHVVDEAAAANIVANPDASDDERTAVAANYLARLDDGVKIIYLGPFASSGTAVLGS